MKDLFVVWYSFATPAAEGWLPSEAMSREEAEHYANRLENGGFQTQIQPRHRVSRLDLIEG